MTRAEKRIKALERRVRELETRLDAIAGPWPGAFWTTTSSNVGPLGIKMVSRQALR